MQGIAVIGGVGAAVQHTTDRDLTEGVSGGGDSDGILMGGGGGTTEAVLEVAADAIHRIRSDETVEYDRAEIKGQLESEGQLILSG